MSERGDRRRTFGRGGTGAGWTAGERENTRRNRRSVDRPVARLDDPSPEEMRQSVKDQWCWWCGRGPWRALSVHTAQAHGITAMRIRELAFWFKSVPTVSESVSAARALAPHNKENIKAAAAVGSRGRPRVMSEAGKASATARILAVSSLEQRKVAAAAAAVKRSHPHPCPVCGKMIQRANPVTCSPECRLEVRRRTGAAVMRARFHNDERDESIREAWRTSGLSQKAIGERFGVVGSRVQQIVRGVPRPPRKPVDRPSLT